jgi:hypothetical protein
MSTVDAARLHKLYGRRNARIAFRKKDFIDYVLMNACTAAIVYVSYGIDSVMSIIVTVLCAFMISVFPIRHGVKLAVPVIVRRPQELVYMLIYKLQNIKPFYLVGLGILLLENYFIYLTPGLPHHVELMRKIAVWLFYVHFAVISIFRTAILVAHLAKREHVREILSQTAWRGAITRQPNISLEIVHAYCTGLLAHIVLITPWYLVIKYLNFSVIATPVIIVINAVTYIKFMQSYSLWFYRDHWLGHNSELEFLYLHGAHHDAIPSGLIGVSGNGHLEGFLRHLIGVPSAFYNPLFAVLIYTSQIESDIRNHQYIPGIWPMLPRKFHETVQHSTHHYGRLEPYSIGLKLGRPKATPGKKKRFSVFPQSAANSVELDEELSGFEWHSPRYKQFLQLYDKYQQDQHTR